MLRIIGQPGVQRLPPFGGQRPFGQAYGPGGRLLSRLRG
jgi:hypothetical protein